MKTRRMPGVDNGDLTNHESHEVNTRALLAQSTREVGAALVEVRSPGLPDAGVAIATEVTH